MLGSTITFGLLGCAGAITTQPSWCVAQPSIARYALITAGVNLAGADLSQADLRGVDLGGTTGEPASATRALSDATTTCANGQPGPCW